MTPISLGLGVIGPGFLNQVPTLGTYSLQATQPDSISIPAGRGGVQH